MADNVKLNLQEIRNQIIKSEDIEDDKNVCRLCLQFVDNDMTLGDGEKEQFQQFFPEIVRIAFLRIESCVSISKHFYSFVSLNFIL